MFLLENSVFWFYIQLNTYNKQNNCQKKELEISLEELN